MSFTAIVENDTIKVPSGIHLPDGTTVRIQTEPSSTATVAAAGTGFAWMDEFIGCIDTLSADFAAEHDHYIRGTPKREAR